MESRHLTPFFLITFAITWGLGAAVLLFGEPLTERFGAIDPSVPFWRVVFHVAVYAPAIAALAVVGAVRGRAGIASFVRRLVRWRAGLGWLIAVAVGFPLLQLTAVVIANVVTGATTPLFGYDPVWAVLPALVLVFVSDPGPVEEFGWRGFALPLLQRRMSALRASLILGVVWGVWHVPAFYIASLSQSSMSLPFFVLNTVVLSLLFTVVYNSTGGTVLLAFVFHAVNNFELAPDAGVPAPVFLATATLGTMVVAFALRRYGPETLGARKETAVLADEPS